LITNTKTGEYFNLKLKQFNTDIVSNANLLSDKIYEKITQTKGIFSTKVVFSMNWNGIRQIFLTDFSGKSFKKLTDNKGDSIAPKLSFSRRYIVYTLYLTGSGTALRLIDLENFEDRPIFSSKEINLAGGFDKEDKRLFFVNFDGKLSKIYELNLSDFTKKELYRSRARIVTPVTNFSDDSIAFVSDEYGSPHIFLLNLKDKKVKKISQTPNYATSPSFTIHGTHFVYVGQTNGKNSLYIASTDGSDFLPLTHGTNSYEDPVWLANERFVLTHIYKGNASQIILIDIPTQQQIKLYSVPAKISYLSAN
jgi:TolB protein